MNLANKIITLFETEVQYPLITQFSKKQIVILWHPHGETNKYETDSYLENLIGSYNEKQTDAVRKKILDYVSKNKDKLIKDK